MKRGELNNLIRDYSERVIEKSPVQMNRRHKALLKTAIKEVVIAILEEVRVEELPENTKAQQEELERMKRVLSEFKKLLP